MAEGALKEQAIAAIHAGRRELGEEAEWLRYKMNPKRVAARVTHEHTVAVLACAFLVGLAVPWFIFGKKNRREESRNSKARDDHRDNHRDHARERADKHADKVKVGAVAYLAGLALRSVTPLLMESGLQIWRHWLSTQKQHGHDGAKPSGVRMRGAGS
jgi:hypothetical protein